MASKRVKLNDLEGQLGERDAVIHELERKLDELKRLVKEKDERISYLEKKRFEPLRRARLFDYGLTGQSSNAKSSNRANTGLTSAQLERLLNDQWRMLKSEGKMAVSDEDCYPYLRQSRTGVTATQLQDDYQLSVSTMNERYVQMGSQLTYLRIKSTRTRLADSIGNPVAIIFSSENGQRSPSSQCSAALLSPKEEASPAPKIFCFPPSCTDRTLP